MEIKRKSNEPGSVFLHRFNRLIQQSGILKDARKFWFYQPPSNRRQRRKAAIYRAKIRKEIQQLKKAGFLKGTEDIKFIKRILRNPKKSKKSF